MFGCTIVLGRRHRKRKLLKKRHRISEIRRRKRRITFDKKKLILPLILLIAVGIIAILYPDKPQNEKEKTNKYITSDVINNVMANTAGDYSEFYLTVVTNNFCNYDEKGELDSEKAITMAIWSIVNSEKDKNEYEFFEEKMCIPKAKINECIEMLFNRNDIKHQSIKTKNFSFEYDNETENYIVPITGYVPEFMPCLTSVENKNGKTVLCVGCLKNENYVQDSKGKTISPNPTKYLEITLKKSKGELYISTIKEQA